MIINDIEDAILTRIKAAPLPYRLKSPKTYGGEFSDGIGTAVINFPTVLIAWNGFTLLRETQKIIQVKSTFAMFCCAVSLRNEGESRKGAAGSYQIVGDMLKLLAGQTLGLKISPLVPRAVRPFVNDKSGQQLASVYMIELETNHAIDMDDLASGLDDFVTFHTDWDVPPHGNVQPPLPTAEADARDHLTLPVEE